MKEVKKTPAKKVVAPKAPAAKKVVEKAPEVVKAAPKAVAEKAPEAVKAAPKAPAAPKAAAPVAKKPEISPEQRYNLIKEAAYFIAERHGFNGDSAYFWSLAEAEVNNRLS